jgi:uncharacterized membrane protein HdeD (DUF308 family)
MFRDARTKAGGVLAFSGVCSLLFGVVFLTGTGRSAQALVLQVAVYAIVMGALWAAAAATIIYERAHRTVS